MIELGPNGDMVIGSNEPAFLIITYLACSDEEIAAALNPQREANLQMQSLLGNSPTSPKDPEVVHKLQGIKDYAAHIGSTDIYLRGMELMDTFNSESETNTPYVIPAALLPRVKQYAKREAACLDRAQEEFDAVMEGGGLALEASITASFIELDDEDVIDNFVEDWGDFKLTDRDAESLASSRLSEAKAAQDLVDFFNQQEQNPTAS